MNTKRYEQLHGGFHDIIHQSNFKSPEHYVMKKVGRTKPVATLPSNTVPSRNKHCLDSDKLVSRFPLILTAQSRTMLVLSGRRYFVSML